MDLHPVLHLPPCVSPPFIMCIGRTSKLGVPTINLQIGVFITGIPLPMPNRPPTSKRSERGKPSKGGKGYVSHRPASHLCYWSKPLPLIASKSIIQTDFTQCTSVAFLKTFQLLGKSFKKLLTNALSSYLNQALGAVFPEIMLKNRILSVFCVFVRVCL